MTHKLSATGFSIQEGKKKTEFVLHINTSGERHTDTISTDNFETYNIYHVTRKEMYTLAQQLIDMGNKMDEES